LEKLIFIVDDEDSILKMLSHWVKNQWNYNCKTFMNGTDAINSLSDNPDLILLDIMLPDIDGYEVCRTLRTNTRTSHIPVIFLTQKDERSDRLQGLELGADDYITKPFDSEVLLHKIKAILKRNEELHREEVNAEFDLGKYHFNPRLRELTVGGKVQTLSPKENELLKMLSEYKNDLLSREIALKKIWGSDTYFNGRSMDVYIAKLRKYLKEDSKLEIVNIHGNGFRLVESE